MLANQCCSALVQTIETLDERADISQHHMWPLTPPTETDGSAALEDGEAAEQELHPWELLPPYQRLAEVLQFLRQHHDYCLFCGCKVRRSACLSARFALNTAPHLLPFRADDSKLQHQLCCFLFVALQYTSAADLAENCPGINEEDH